MICDRFHNSQSHDSQCVLYIFNHSHYSIGGPRAVDRRMLLPFLTDLLYRIKKVFLHIFTGKSEIHRLLLPNSNARAPENLHSMQMSLVFANSLFRSKKLQRFASPIFLGELFDAATVASVIEREKLPSMSGCSSSQAASIIRANLSLCLYSLRFYNTVANNLKQSKGTTFDASDSTHVAMLDELWNDLMPDTRRCIPDLNTNKIASDSWGDIGFQGKDPSTDFRGMGLLALLQLSHFAKLHTTRARSVLAVSINPTRAYFPFAATGINLTFFVMELVGKHGMYGTVLRALDKHGLDSSEADPSDSSELVRLATESIHDAYANLFCEFADLWVRDNPKDLMQFPGIFAGFKSRVKERLLLLPST